MAYTTIKKPSDYFNTKLYTGNGSTQSITGVGFQPDFIWVKDRTSANYHELQDIVRGAGKGLFTNDILAETTGRTLYQFDSDGFSLDGNQSTTNVNGDNYVAWNWLASNTTASNTDGSITSTVSANTTSGFSIVKYTGTGSASTIGHGLGSAPKMIIVKPISTSGVWLTWHTGISINGQLQLQSSDAVYNPGTSIYWNSTLPTSSVFSVGTSGATNGSGVEYIAYCFAEKQGFSKFGSYVGNGNADGTFVYTGFKPSFIMLKNADAGGTWWHMIDNKRNPHNVISKVVFSNSSDAEYDLSNYHTDIVSNGFKLRTTTGTGMNASGNTYIYMAFAEEPLVGDNPATAR